MYVRKFVTCGDELELTYVNGEIHEIIVNKADLVSWDGLKHIVPFYCDELTGAIQFKELKMLAIDKKIAAFCNAYKKAFGVVHEIQHKEKKALSSVRVSDELLEYYFSANEWWCKDKNALNYCFNFMNVKKGLANPKVEESKYPNKWDRIFYNKLKDPQEIMAYKKHLRDLGFKAKKNLKGDVVEWVK